MFQTINLLTVIFVQVLEAYNFLNFPAVFILSFQNAICLFMRSKYGFEDTPWSRSVFTAILSRLRNVRNCHSIQARLTHAQNFPRCFYTYQKLSLTMRIRKAGRHERSVQLFVIRPGAGTTKGVQATHHLAPIDRKNFVSSGILH